MANAHIATLRNERAVYGRVHVKRVALALAFTALTVPAAFAAAPGADLLITKTADTDTPIFGTEVVFTLKVTNSGPKRARDVTVTDQLSSGYSYVEDDGAGAYDPVRGEWDIGRLQSNSVRTLRITATVNASGEYANEAIVTSRTADPDPGNNVAVLTITPRFAPPNIVVIMLDDLDTRTLDDLLAAELLPNIKTAIVDRSVNFTESFVTNPICCPSRATFLTGQYSQNNGVKANLVYVDGIGTLPGVVGLDDSNTLATRLQALGYITAHVGKYLNGYGRFPSASARFPVLGETYVPPGWTSWHGLVDPTTYCVYDYKINHNGVVASYLLEPGETENSAIYQTHVLADISADFVREHKEDINPFFLAVMPMAPHVEVCASAYNGEPRSSPFDYTIRPAPEDSTAPVPDFVPGPAYNEDTSDKPDFLANVPSLDADDLDAIAAQYRDRLRSIIAVDRMVGELIDALGPDIENTAIIFTSDNGWLYGERRWTGKRYAYDESARVSLYVRVPHAGGVASSRDQLVLNNDLAPTILKLADPESADADFDGRSIVPLFAEPPSTDWIERRQFLIQSWRTRLDSDMRHPTNFALRTRELLYIESTDQEIDPALPDDLIGLEFYDLLFDPFQLDSVLHHPEDLPDPVLHELLENLKSCAGDACRELENAGS